MVDSLGAVLKIVEKRWLGRHFGQPRIVVHEVILAILSRELRSSGGRAELAVGHIEQRRFRNEYIEIVAHLPLEGIRTRIQRCLVGHNLILPNLFTWRDSTPARMPGARQNQHGKQANGGGQLDADRGRQMSKKKEEIRRIEGEAIYLSTPSKTLERANPYDQHRNNQQSDGRPHR